ncbi:MAG TPA: heme o synthase [Gemmataceae bacterium]|jgi:protoheme IX farnesyltransferase
MKSAVTVCAEAPALTRPRLADYVELAKPRVAVLVLFTVGAGVLLASGRNFQFLVLLHTVLGTALVAAGASALNQWIERDSDALMRRTEKRPLPSGRLQALEVLVFGLLLGLVGVLYLALTLNRITAALVAAATFVLYVAVYTPLKRRTPLNTLIGAVPGALPPIIGWCAVRGEITQEAGMLFLILFLWQVPHFLAIAWIYRDEYARAGLRMLPVVDPQGQRTAQNMILYCLVLLVVSLQPALFGSAGVLYLSGATLLGLAFLATALGFQRWRSLCQARRVLRASLLYLPGLLALLLLDRTLGL